VKRLGYFKRKERFKKLLPLYSSLSVKNAILLINVFEGNFINGWKVLRQKILFSPTSGKLLLLFCEKDSFLTPCVTFHSTLLPYLKND
jgi:hypothetical protein